EQIAAMPRVRLTFLYLEIDNSKPYHVWIDENGQSHIYGGMRNVAQASPGMIYVFPVPSEGSILLTQGKYAGNHDNKEDVALWAALHRANRERLASIRKVSAEAGEERLQQYIDPLARAYSRMNAPQRAQFIAWIVRKIIQADI
ncbi:MAG: hypothetical protein KDE31_36790, partial [Caldilineaceae bacterium]|nr:hypothetical protein [Caldilineaceae bacterium]